MQDDIFFTTIPEPKKFRKGLLTSSKEIISIMKDYHMLLKMREAKREKIESLKHQFNELNGLMEELNAFLPEEAMNQLHALMPKPEVKEEPEPEEVDEPEAMEEHDESTEEPEESAEEPEMKELTGEDAEIAKLENALQAIESKLRDV